MKVMKLHETPVRENSREFSLAFLNRVVVNCGVVSFEPGCFAHRGEKHVHEHDEVFIVLAGEITVPIGPESGATATDVARAGDWVFVAKGEEHHLTNHAPLPCVAMYLVLKK